jgi:hypothetical protein
MYVYPPENGALTYTYRVIFKAGHEDGNDSFSSQCIDFSIVAQVTFTYIRIILGRT